MKELNKGVVKFMVEVVFPAEHAPVAYYSNELWKRIVRYNNPEWRKIYFSKTQSMTEEVNNDFNNKSLCRRYRKEKGQWIYAKQYIGFNFWYRETGVEPASGRSDFLSVHITNDTKTILGYNCRKAEVVSSIQKMNVWFTTELSLKDDTGAFLHIEGIDGIIMEWDEAPVAKNVYFYLKYTMVDISEEIDERTAFNLPSGYREFENSERVKTFAFDLLKEEKVREPARLEAIAGKWLFNPGTDNTQLNIESSSDSNFTVTRKTWQDGHEDESFITKQSAFLAGRDLVVGDESDFYLLELKLEDRQWWLNENEIFSYRKI